jgi:hypothetical protein
MAAAKFRVGENVVRAVRTTSCPVLLERAQLWDETREYPGVDEVA